MDKLDKDLDDSIFFCKSLIQKRKAYENINPKQSKQLKLNFYQTLNKTIRSSQDEQVSVGSLEEKIKPTKSHNEILKKNESESGYFHMKKLINSCPLCLKSFKSESTYSAHMKQCAKTHKMTTQQLLEALELQKKQMQERRDMGLCSQIIPPPKKNTKKKIKNDNECYDLALGFALSESLATCETKTVSTHEVQKTTLEEFGFNSNNAGTSKKKNENKKYSLLKSRTSEERQKIIVEKVAVILLDEDLENDMEKKKVNNNSTSQKTQVPQLWSLGENDEKQDWYVSKIKTLMLEEESTVEDDKPMFSECMENELAKLGLPQREIYKDWNKMINNSFKSDLIGKTKDSRDIFLHSLVLFTRCPDLLEKDLESIFQKYNLSTVLIFLEYLYCGTLNHLVRSEINNLYHLASELNFNELITVVNKLKNNLLEGGCHELSRIRNSPVEQINKEKNDNNLEITVIENKKVGTVDEKDLFTEEDVVDLTQSSPEPDKVCRSLSENESNAEKSYWSFIQQEKNKIDSEKTKRLVEEKEISPTGSKIEKETYSLTNTLKFNNYEGKEKDSESTNLNNPKDLRKQMSEDSVTKDLVDEFQNRDEKMNSNNCIIVSSDSESKTDEIFKSQRERSKTPSSTDFDCEVPYFDPYENFHCFSEEQFSPVALHSQSLLLGDISTESLKSSNSAKGEQRQLDVSFQEEPRIVGYCSTPVTVSQVSKIKSAENSSKRSDQRKRCSLSGSRILRKSLGLQHKLKKRIDRRRRNCQTKEFAEALTNSILNELSKSSVFNSPSPRMKKFVEITPTVNKEEFGESVTPYPNYSNMGESMLKAQLTKYGLKKNLAKSKARKILRHIYEELHPFYNAETGKMVKVLPADSPNVGKKSKSRETHGKRAKTKQTKKDVLEKKKQTRKQKNHLNSSKESGSDASTLSLDRPTDHDSDRSEFDDLSETLTQSIPSNPVDLPSAFNEFIQNNSEYYQKILLYEPIWLEELQKNLKEVFKKHFKMSDLMDFLDQKCITFRSAAQMKNFQKRNEKKKENSKKKKNI